MSDQTVEARQVSPDDLEIGVSNIRLDPRLDQPLIDSVEALGVLQPVLARRNALGQLMVLDGQRRVLAARRAGLSEIPVVELPDDDAEGAAARATLSQMALNTARLDLTPGEQSQAVAQLALFGVSEDEIAKASGLDRRAVRGLSKMASTPSTRDLVEAVPELTIMQAATLADLADSQDAATAENLAESIRRTPTQTDFILERAVQARDAAIHVDARIAELVASGVRAMRYTDAAKDQALSKQLVDLWSLADGKGKSLDREDHRTCPGCVILVDFNGYGQIIEWDRCENPTTHGHRVRGSHATSKSPEQASQERREVIEKNKDALAAEALRRRFVGSLIVDFPRYWMQLVYLAAAHTTITAAATGSDSAPGALLADFESTMPAEGLSLNAWVAQHPRRRSSRALFAVAWAAIEGWVGKSFWRDGSPWIADYFRLLQEWGYTLSDLEDAFCSAHPQQSDGGAR